MIWMSRLGQNIQQSIILSIKMVDTSCESALTAEGNSTERNTPLAKAEGGTNLRI